MTDYVEISEVGPSINRLLKKFGRRADRLEHFLTVLSQDIHAAVIDKFENEGPGWAPLKESTIKRKRGDGPGKILQDSTNMVNSIEPFHSSWDAGVFTNVPYALFHLEGTKHMEERDFFAIDLDQILEDFEENLIFELGSKAFR